MIKRTKEIFNYYTPTPLGERKLLGLSRKLLYLPAIFLPVATPCAAHTRGEIVEALMLGPAADEHRCRHAADVPTTGTGHLEDMPFAQVTQANRVSRAEHDVLKMFHLDEIDSRSHEWRPCATPTP